MEIEFSKAQEVFLQQQVETGQFVSVEKAVRTAVRELEQRTEAEQRALDEIRRFVSVGAEAALRGEVVPFDVETIRREGSKLLAP